MTTDVDAILNRIATKRSFKQHLLLLREQTNTSIRDELIWKVLTSVAPEHLDRLGLKLGIEITIGGNGQTQNKIRCQNIIGSTRIACEFGELSIVIEPKVEVSRLVAILNYVNGDNYFSNNTTETFSGHTDLLLIQVVRCLDLITRSLSGGSIRGYGSVKKVLPYVRGKADFRTLIDERDAPHYKIPCRFFEQTIDTSRNRVFKTTLVKIAKLLSERDKTLFDLARLHLYSLSGTQLTDVPLNSINLLIKKYPRDTAALLACRDILGNVSFSAHPNISRPFFSYAINMADLFQNYCNLLLTHALSGLNLQPHKTLIFPIKGVNSEIRLDGLYGNAHRSVLMEAKYKTFAEISDLNLADLYQLVAYCNHNSLCPTSAVLIFPSDDADCPKILGKVDDFRLPCKTINLIGINLAMHPTDNVLSLNKVVSGILREQH